MEIRQQALFILQLQDPTQKRLQAQGLWRAYSEGAELDAQAQWLEPAGLPGRPTQPTLVPPAQVARRSPFTSEGRAALLHAVAHIEFDPNRLADVRAPVPGLVKQKLGMK